MKIKEPAFATGLRGSFGVAWMCVVAAEMLPGASAGLGFIIMYAYNLGQLSGGMKQCVSVARALAIRPDILLMDEPFSALDPFTRRELQDEILRIRKEMDMTIVLVTHNPEEAVYLADRVIMLFERPSSISNIIKVSLSHPRNPADPGFLTVREEISGMVRK